jgi:hypothetical protein
MKAMDAIVTKKLWELKPHSQNELIFGDPRNVPEYDEIKNSIRDSGVQEPIVIKDDGTILSGHLRFCALKDIAAENGKFSHEVDVQVRVHPGFISMEREMEYLFAANTQRRQLSPKQIAFAYKALLGNIEQQPKVKEPRRKRGEAPRVRRPEIRERVARLFNVSVRNAENLAVIYQTAGVPVDVMEMVDQRQVSAKVAAEAVKFAIEEARRRDPNGPVVVAPIDVLTYLSYPKTQGGTRIRDLIKGVKPQPDGPILVDGMPVTGYYGQVETADIPPPFMPKQTVRDMILRGVEYSEQDYSDPGLPLHEAVGRLRLRLIEAFSNAHNINEGKVVEALEPMLERTAHYLRSLGKEVSVSTGEKPATRSMPEALYEKLVLFRAVLEEEDASCDPAVLRTILTDISRAAQERASTLRKEQKAIQSKATATSSVPRTERPSFATDLDFIAHVIGQSTLDFLSRDP